MKVLNLGWGLQSWTMAAMAALRELPRPDIIIHADTTWERQATYEFARAHTPWLRDHGLNVITVCDPSAHGFIKQEWEGTFIPAFTLNQEGERGMLDRQCTSRWKIQPIRQFLRGIILSTHLPMEDKIYALDWAGYDFEWSSHMGVSEEVALYDIFEHIEATYGKIKLPKWLEIVLGSRFYETPAFDWLIADKVVKRWVKWNGRFAIKKDLVEQWLGITVDEIQRAKDSDIGWIRHHYPLLDLNMRRVDCETWLKKHGLPIPPKSRCKFCPYMNRRSWQDSKREGGQDWQIALYVDNKIRYERPEHTIYVHPGRKPLDEAVIIEEDFGYTQPVLIDIDDSNMRCDSGHCFM